ncbi:30S ribosomal protein S20 [Candidatus Peregrinibacteria bacterium]|nr:30S ribosomal protein S20 [Candidatus Peregrinibacteria bacterium]
MIRKAVKQARQSLAHAARNKVFRNEMRSMIKLFLGYIQKKDAEKAAKVLPKVVSIIDTCFKKNLIHRNNAANKKSRMQRELTKLQKGGGAPAEAVAKAPKAPKAAKVAKAPKAAKSAKPAKKAKA